LRLTEPNLNGSARVQKQYSLTVDQSDTMFLTGCCTSYTLKKRSLTIQSPQGRRVKPRPELGLNHGRPMAPSWGNATPCPAMAGRKPNRKMAFFYSFQDTDMFTVSVVLRRQIYYRYYKRYLQFRLICD